jgi:molecular chaperone IbpA
MGNLDPFGRFSAFTVGFDRVFDELSNFSNNAQSYPPYNLIREDENNYRIEIAVAGFSSDDLEVNITENKLEVIGDKESDNSETYLHAGIANRKFRRAFVLTEDVVVNSADIWSGVLVVRLEKIIPESKKTKLIPIGVLTDNNHKSVKFDSKKQQLNG